MHENIISIKNLSKKYSNGLEALKNINLDIRQGEIFALLGPNGAGKTTLINIICGLVNSSEGQVIVAGHDIIKDYRTARSLIGLVPQELTTDAFESVWNTVNFSRSLFGKPKDSKKIEKILKDLSLIDKRNNRLMTLSGGMKRRLMIAKALSHEPRILFLDEPTAGVDVELRKSMWQQVRALKESGVTIILTTHYIEEAEEMADRIGVINQGQLILTEQKKHLIQKLGAKSLTFDLNETLSEIPGELHTYNLELCNQGAQLIFKYDSGKKENRIAELLAQLAKLNIHFKDLYTKQSSLEDIFVSLVKKS